MLSVHNQNNAFSDLGKTERLSLKSMLNGKILELPPNQRPYSWGIKELSDLWEDLMCLNGRFYEMGPMVLQVCSRSCDNLNTNSGNASEPSQLFIISKSGETYVPFLLVDGQQRMLSLIILLRVLCDYACSIEMIDFIESTLLFCKGSSHRETGGNNEDSSKKSAECVTRLGLHSQFSRTFVKLLQTDDLREKLSQEQGKHQSILKQILLQTFAPIRSLHSEFHDKLTTPEQLMIKAYQYFDSMISQKRSSLGAVDEKCFHMFVQDLLVTITDKLIFDVVISNPGAEIGTIFRSRNCRGKPLTLIESLKNFLMHYASTFNDDQLVSTIDNLWCSIYSQFSIVDLPSNCDENYFVKSFWSYYSESPIKGDDREIYHEIQCYISERADIKAKILEFVAEMLQCVTLFCSIHSLEFSEDHLFTIYEDVESRRKCFTICRNLRKLHCLDAFIGVLVQSLRFSSCKTFLSIAIACERYSMTVYRLSGKKMNSSTSWFRKLITAIRVAKIRIVPHLFDRIMEHADRQMDTNRIFEFLTGSNTNFTEWKYTKYLLEACELHLISTFKGTHSEGNREETWEMYKYNFLDTEIPVTTDELSVEHIMPKNFADNSDWIDAFGSANSCSQFLHRLGNLTLSARERNSSYGDDSFSNKSHRKTVSYSNSSLLIERELCSFADWNPDSIIVREERLCRIISQIWNISLPVDYCNH